MRAPLTAIIIVCGLLLTARAEAGTFTFQKAQVTIDLPDDWVTDDQGDHVTFASPDQALAINIAWAGDDPAVAWTAVTTQVKAIVKGVSIKKKPGEVGGLAGHVATGKGKLGGTKVDVRLAVVKTPNAAMSVFVIGETGKWEKHKAQLERVLDSLWSVGVARVVVTGPDFESIEAGGQRLAIQLGRAIARDDATAFVKLVSKKGLKVSDGGSGKPKVTKTAKLAAAIKKAGGLTAFLGMPATGDFAVEMEYLGEDLGHAFTMTRGPVRSVVYHLRGEWSKKGWSLVGSYPQDHGVDDDTE